MAEHPRPFQDDGITVPSEFRIESIYSRMAIDSLRTPGQFVWLHGSGSSWAANATKKLRLQVPLDWPAGRFRLLGRAIGMEYESKLFIAYYGLEHPDEVVIEYPRQGNNNPPPGSESEFWHELVFEKRSRTRTPELQAQLDTFVESVRARPN